MTPAYSSSTRFNNLKTQDNALSDRVKQLYNMAQQTPLEERTPILNQLILAIHAFDEHMRTMIAEFPDYYNDFKAALDTLLAANDNYIAATHSEIRRLQSTKDN